MRPPHTEKLRLRTSNSLPSAASASVTSCTRRVRFRARFRTPHVVRKQGSLVTTRNPHTPRSHLALPAWLEPSPRPRCAYNGHVIVLEHYPFRAQVQVVTPRSPIHLLGQRAWSRGVCQPEHGSGPACEPRPAGNHGCAGRLTGNDTADNSDVTVLYVPLPGDQARLWGEPGVWPTGNCFRAGQMEATRSAPRIAGPRCGPAGSFARALPVPRREGRVTAPRGRNRGCASEGVADAPWPRPIAKAVDAVPQPRACTIGSTDHRTGRCPTRKGPLKRWTRQNRLVPQHRRQSTGEPSRQPVFRAGIPPGAPAVSLCITACSAAVFAQPSPAQKLTTRETAAPCASPDNGRPRSRRLRASGPATPAWWRSARVPAAGHARRPDGGPGETQRTSDRSSTHNDPHKREYGHGFPMQSRATEGLGGGRPLPFQFVQGRVRPAGKRRVRGDEIVPGHRLFQE
jgi:hypothetical protein